MTSWEDLQPKLREAVLAERAAGRATGEIADEIHVGRTTLFRMLADDGTPTKAAQAFAEEFVECHVGRLAEPEPDE